MYQLMLNVLFILKIEQIYFVLMIKVRLKIFIIIILEICCALCHYENLHSKHKLIKFSDDEIIKKEKITIESTKKDFNEYSKKIMNLKSKIETEINKINNLYDKTIDDLTKSYKKKHELLLQEENKLKEKLKNEVTKIKEKLELFLSESNSEIKISENIEKGIKRMEKEDKNIIKILYYVSKINKIKKNMRK